MTDIIHSASKIFLHSNAENAFTNGTSSSYTFQIEPLIIGSTDESTFILGLESASIPLSFYAINQTNDTFSINGTPYNITNGNYSYTSILTQLNNITGLTWAYNLDTNKLKITTAGSYTFNVTADSATNVLGFIEGTTYNANVEFDKVVNLTYTTGVQIRLDNISTSNISADRSGGSSILARLPITTPAYTILQFFNPQPFYTTIKNKTLTEISISLLDDDSNLLILNGSPNWFVTLRIDYNIPTKLSVDKTNIQKLREEALAPLQEKQQEEIEQLKEEEPTTPNDYVAPKENLNRIVKRDLVSEIIQRNLDKQMKQQKRPLRLQKKINRKIKIK
ncbi:MAG: hypothetical protein ACO3UU_10400 [Minisyncoccia bacterium]